MMKLALALLLILAVPAEGQSGRITVEPGVELFYRTVGNGPQAVVIPMVMDGQAEALAPLSPGRTLIFYAPRGRGRSSTVEPSKVTIENELRDLEAVRAHFKLERMALVGWSHYGMMTALYTIRHPDRVSRLVQMAPAGPQAGSYLEKSQAELRSRVDGPSWNALEEKRKAKAFAGKPVEECREMKKVLLPPLLGDRSLASRIPLGDCELPNEQPANQAVWWGALNASLGSWDLRPDLRALRVPRLVVAGDKDFIPMTSMRDWAAGMPEARLLVLPGVGHMPHVEAPEAFLAAVKTFLDGSWPAGAETLEVPKS